MARLKRVFLYDTYNFDCPFMISFSFRFSTCTPWILSPCFLLLYVPLWQNASSHVCNNVKTQSLLKWCLSRDLAHSHLSRIAHRSGVNAWPLTRLLACLYRSLAWSQAPSFTTVPSSKKKYDSLFPIFRLLWTNVQCSEHTHLWDANLVPYFPFSGCCEPMCSVNKLIVGMRNSFLFSSLWPFSLDGDLSWLEREIN